MNQLFDEVASYAALVRAARRAARGKRSSAAAARFLDSMEPECLRLERDLRAGIWRPSRANTFRIFDPKPRTITAVPFADRVVHDALIGALEPVFERRMIAHSFASRSGKGLHAALSHAKSLVRTRRFALRMDVASFFDSLRHDVVFATVARIVKDAQVLALIERILIGSDPAGRFDKGLPIGSLTSQWFANLVLDRLDHHVKETLRVRAYTRYMDDVVVFDDDRDRLRFLRDEITRFLAVELALQPKDKATRLGPCVTGVPFLGFLIFPGTVRLRPANLRRSLWRMRELRHRLVRGAITEDRFRAGVASVVAHVSHANTMQLRRTWFAKHDLEL